MHYLDQWTTRKLGNNSFYSDWEISLTYDKNGNLLTNLTEAMIVLMIISAKKHILIMHGDS